VESVSTAKKDEGFASDAQRKAAFASGYKEPKNKKKKEEGNAFGAALQAAKEKGEKTFTVAGKQYDVKTEEGKLDKVNPTAVKKKFDDRKDKDIDNDGDVDDSDKFLHKRRKAISKAVKSEEVNEKVEYVEYKFKNKNDAIAAKKMLDAVQLMGFDVNDDGASQGELTVDAGNKDMTKYHKEIMKKFRPKVLTQEKKEEVKEETTLAMKAAQYMSSMWAEAAAEKDGVKTKSEEEEEPKKNGKTMTGKEMSKVEIAPKDKV